MSYVQKQGLKWALGALNEFRGAVQVRPRQNLFRFFLLKALGVRQEKVAEAREIGTPDFRAATARFLEVTFDGDPTAARTGGASLYFNPFTFEYPHAAGGSDFAVGTMWTRCETWRKNGFIDFKEAGGKRRIVFQPDYVAKLKKSLGGKRIPAVALAAFFFRRPEDSEIEAATVATTADLGRLLEETFSLTPEETRELFDFESPDAKLEIFGTAPQSRVEVLDLLADIAPLPSNDGGDDALGGDKGTPSVGVKWKEVDLEKSEPCGLLGLGDAFRQAVAALRSGRNVIFIGPPGTGKTELAICLCQSLGAEYDLVTATSDWTTYDTIGAYMPDPEKGGDLDFMPALVTRALASRRWLLIDEINRADIDKAFGELFTLLSGRAVRLPFRKRVDGKGFQGVVLGDGEEDEYSIPVPEDWRIVGTMNTFDKASLFQLSYAFMRRFAFIDVPVPSEENFSQVLEGKASKSLADCSEDFARGCLALLKAVFCPPGGDTGLAGAGVPVGPSIPLDAVKYIREKYVDQPGLAPKAAVLEALKMFLFPQFEGRENRHEKIREMLKGALSLNATELADLDSTLATWTGYEPSSD